MFIHELDFSSLNCCLALLGRDLPEQLDAPLSDACLGALPDLQLKLDGHRDISSIEGAGRTKIGRGLSPTLLDSSDSSSYEDDALEVLDFLENEDFLELALDACEREDFFESSSLLKLWLLPTLLELLTLTLICCPSKLGVD